MRDRFVLEEIPCEHSKSEKAAQRGNQIRSLNLVWRSKRKRESRAVERADVPSRSLVRDSSFVGTKPLITRSKVTTEDVI